MADVIKRDTVDYRDPTPFDNTKLNSLSDISKALRHKTYGEDTREAIAQQGEALAKLMTETGGNQSAEVVAARGNFELLGIRLDAHENAIGAHENAIGSKADKHYVYNYLSSMTYSPETALSIDDLNNKYPAGKPGIFITADTGHKYIWVGSAWKDVGVYQSNGIADESIEDIKIKRAEIRQETLAFVPGVARKSNNLFDKNRVLIGRVISTNPNVILNVNDDYFTSDWIYCRGESNVTIKTCTFIEFADKSLKRVSVINNASNATITTEVPFDASYFRISASISETDKGRLNINFGKNLLEYESYDNKTGMAQLDKDVTSVLENVPENSKKLVYGKLSANLFNSESADNQVGKRVIPFDGKLTDQSDYSVSHKIKFIKGLDYSFDKVVFYAFYKDGGDYISGGSNPVTVTAPDDYAGYMLVSASNVNFDKIMVSQSSEKQDYESYNAKVTYNQLSNELQKTVASQREISVTLEVSLDYNKNTTGFGTTKFNSLIAAHNSVTDSSVDKQYLILVHPGTYDDWSTTWPITSTDASGMGIAPKPYEYFESTDIQHPEKYILKWNGHDGLDDNTKVTSAQAFQRCLFQLNQYPRNTQIRGFTFDANNVRYCLHIETSGRGDGNNVMIENCIFKWGGNTMVDGFYGAPLGMGISAGETVTIKNCKWNVADSVTDATAGHNNSYQIAADKFIRPAAILKMENCDFAGLNFRMDTVTPLGQTDIFDEIYLKNCRNISRAYNGLQGSATENNWKADVRFTSIKVNDLNQP